MPLVESAPSLEFVLQRRGIASSREMSEAIARCELHGGDLTTSLLQFVDADESQLSSALSDCHRLPAAPVGLLPTSDRTVQTLVPREVAERYCCFPLRSDGNSLTLAVANPLDTGVSEELSFALGVRLNQRIALEVRVRQAIARDYALSLSPRDQRAIARLEGDLKELRSETPTGLWGVSSLSTLPRPPSELPNRRKLSRPPLTPRATTLKPSGRAPSKKQSPMGLARFRESLADATSRDLVVGAFFRFVGQFFEYSALFAIHGTLAEGLEAQGDGTAKEELLGLGVPLDLPSSFARIIEAGKPRVGSLARDGLDATLLQDLRRSPSPHTLLVPILLRDRCVLLLYADNGATELLESEVSDILTSTKLISPALEAIILQKKRQASKTATGQNSHINAPSSEPQETTPSPSSELSSEDQHLVAQQVVSIEPSEPTSPATPSPAPVDPVFLLERTKSSTPENTAIQQGDSAPLQGAQELTVQTHVSYPPRRYDSKKLPSVIVRNDTPEPPSQKAEVPRHPIPLANTPGLAIDVEVDMTPHHMDIDVTVEHSPTPSATKAQELQPGATPTTSGSLKSKPSSTAVVEIEHSEEREPFSNEEGEDTAPPITSLPEVEEKPLEQPFPPHQEDQKKSTAASPAEAPTEPGPNQDEAKANPPSQNLEQTGDRELHSKSEPESSAEVKSNQGEVVVPSRIESVQPGNSTPIVPAALIAPTPTPEECSTAKSELDSPRLPKPSAESPSASSPSPVPETAEQDPEESEATAQVQQLVDRLCDGDLEASQQVTKLGHDGVPELMKRFPGPVITERAGPSSRASDCGPLLQTLVAIGTPATANITPFTTSQDDHVRRWATLLLGELPGPEACRAVVQRLGDNSPRVHQAALDAGRLILRSPSAGLFRRTLFEVAESDVTSSNLRLRILEHVAKLQDSASVPRLISLLDAGPTPSRHKVLWALTVITRQDFGRAVEPWQKWWQEHQGQHRIQWLIEALNSPDARLRKAAADDLRQETKETYGFSPDQSPQSRKQTQRLYQQWWQTLGIRRFGRLE